MGNSPRIDIEDELEHFSYLEESHSSINQPHPPTNVAVIAIMAILAGANGPTAIAKWAKIKQAFLENWLPLPHGVPSKDVFRRVLMAMNPKAFQACFEDWLGALRVRAVQATGVEPPTYAVDEEAPRRTHDRGKNPGALHSMSIWASELGLTLAQVATEEKPNEMMAILRALELVDLNGAIVTIDARGAQTAIAQQIVEGKGDYILALKGNQGPLYEAAVKYLEQQASNDLPGIGARCHATTEEAHGRTETRTYIQMPVPQDLPDTGIENTCLWRLDVTYRVDDSRIRDEHLRENFAWLNRFILSLLKQHRGKDSIALKRRACGWNENYLLEILTGTTT